MTKKDDAMPEQSNIQQHDGDANEASATVFLARLAMDGGAIVSSNCLSPNEIDFYRRCRRFFVDANGFGYAILNEYWRKIGDEANRARTVHTAQPPAQRKSK